MWAVFGGWYDFGVRVRSIIEEFDTEEEAEQAINRITDSFKNNTVFDDFFVDTVN